MAVSAAGGDAWLSGKLGLLAGGGAIGNIYDRLMFSRVTDFIVWKYTGKDGIPHGGRPSTSPMRRW